MADHRDPKPGEVWERDGKQRIILGTSGPYPYRVAYKINNTCHVSLVEPTWTNWSKKATCIKEATDG